MPLDKYKTQVLLLHSEQSTLDNLSSGFGDRYTVHCATSGSEALNTLVDTPINVIVTAQDLPGMSGLEALREARKRSPDTIGILLAGNRSSDIEALVGDEEVFQVVSGTVTGDGLRTLVDNATRQMRLMALAESANDMSANVDEPAEHIIMETSENGSTIISDGTGRMPALNPEKVSPAANIGARSVDLLVLTKDREFLDSIKDSARGMHHVHYANTLGQANEAIRQHKVGVAVVDAAMVGAKVEQLTEILRKTSPRLVSIVAGRRDDGEMLMDLINRGKVYRFLLKPVSPGRARLAIEASVKHHLEAPDAAFRPRGGASAPARKAEAHPVPAATAKPAVSPAAKPVVKPAMKPLDKPAEKPVAKAAAAASGPAAMRPPADPPLGSASSPADGSPIDDALADAFGKNDVSFTETVTSLISNVSQKFSSGGKDKAETVVATTTAAPVVEPRDLPDTAGGSGSLFTRQTVLGIAAAVAVIIAGGAYWALSGPRDPAIEAPNQTPIQARTPTFQEQGMAVVDAPVQAAADDVAAILEQARLARDAGRLFAPEGNNAIEGFAAAVDAAPYDRSIADEFDAVINEALTMAESAMLEARLDDSGTALSRVAAADPDNVRLPFLTAQLAQMQLRAHLDDARLAIRENRFEDAASAVAAARNLDAADIGEVDAVHDELAAARSAQRLDRVIEQAEARLASGDLLTPVNDNARYYFSLALSNDPQNPAARRGLDAIASKLAFQARADIDAGDLNSAEDTLASARALDPDNSEVAATFAALADARAAVISEQQRAAAARQAAAERQAALERQAEQERREEAARIAAAERKAEQEQQAEALRNAEAEREADAAAPAADAQPAVADNVQIADDADPVPDQTATALQPAAISSFNRTRYVAPKYPRSAARRNLSGWVDVVFTVTIEGTVADIEVRNSEPGDTFVNAAIRAVEKWEFEPVVENGVLVAKRAGVRMMFALE